MAVSEVVSLLGVVRSILEETIEEEQTELDLLLFLSLAIMPVVQQKEESFMSKSVDPSRFVCARSLLVRCNATLDTETFYSSSDDLRTSDSPTYH